MSKIVSKREQTQLDRDYMKEHLLAHYVKEGDKVYTILRSVSTSGMTRNISLVVARDSEIIDITYYAAHAIGDKVSESKGQRVIKVNGAGMDMGFHLVYNLSSVLFHGQERAGYALRQGWL